MKLGNILIIGDSYSTYIGHIPEGFAPYYTGKRETPPDLFDVKDTWWSRLIDETGATLIQNNSWSGSTICNTGYNGVDCSKTSSFVYRLEKLYSEGFFDKNRIDQVFVFGGTNDCWAAAPLGELKFEGVSDEELFYVLPAIGHLSKRLSEILPNAQIFLIANSGIGTAIPGALKKSAEKFGFTYVGITPDVEKINNHPTKKGMEQIKDIIKLSMQRQLRGEI